MKRKRFHSYIMMTCLGFVLIITAVLAMFFHFDRILSNQGRLNSEFYRDYIYEMNNTLLSDMSRYIENRYPILEDTDFLRQQVGTDWFWGIADEWRELAKSFNFAYIYYIEKTPDNSNYKFLMSAGMQRDTNSGWLDDTVWEEKPPAFIDEAWETKLLTFTTEPTVDEWGTLISVARPIISNGRVVGILGVDYDVSFLDRLKDHELALMEQQAEMRAQVILIFVSTIVIVIAIIGYLLWVNKTSVLVSVEEKEAERVAILSSLEYASTIQKNLLPTDSEAAKAFSDSCVIWKPRDIVGGDIYWMKRFDTGTVLCACDCTGHGTSGALLSMLVVSALEATIRQDNCGDTAEIIWRLEQRLVDVFGIKTGGRGDDDNSICDGCDLAALFIDNDGNVTLSAGHTNVFVCDGEKVQRFRGQRIFVGEGNLSSKQDIETVNIPANPNYKFYIASDGLFDQPGGEFSRPFGYKKFKRVILENHLENMSVISDRIWESFEAYRGEVPRVDDFELISFKP